MACAVDSADVLRVCFDALALSHPSGKWLKSEEHNQGSTLWVEESHLWTGTEDEPEASREGSPYGAHLPLCATFTYKARSQTSFGDRLGQAIPAAAVEQRIEWTRLVAAEATEALAQGSAAGEKACIIDVNSGGEVFFALLRPGYDSCPEEVVVLKFYDDRHMLQSEQMAAELARHLEVAAPPSRILIRSSAEDQHEWTQLLGASTTVCERLADAMMRHQAMLVIQFVPGDNLRKETEAWSAERLRESARAIGRLFVLDVLLGNSDRLPIKSLRWRGNPSNLIWRTPRGNDGGCVPIDAVVARRPPKAFVQRNDALAAEVLEMALLDAQSSQGLLMEAVHCNVSAVTAFESSSGWQGAFGLADGDTEAQASPPVPAMAVAFKEGLKSALDLALRERGLLEMLADVLGTWIDAFMRDMRKFTGDERAPKQGSTQELRQISSARGKSDEMQERLASWQTTLQERSGRLRKAADEWAERRGLTVSLSFKGFLGDDVLNPVSDAYELLVRLRQLLARVRVLADVATMTRPYNLSPTPLFVGPVTSADCFHYMRHMGITCVLCTAKDLLEPSAEARGKIAWHRLELADLEEQELGSELERGLSIVDEVVASGGKVLVHCHEGKSRSVALCLSYMMTREKRALSEALALVKARRREIRPNAGFWRQLMDLELATFGSNSVTAEDVPKGKPKGVLCDICGQKVGLSAAALASHKRLKHKIVAAGA